MMMILVICGEKSLKLDTYLQECEQHCQPTNEAN